MLDLLIFVISIAFTAPVTDVVHAVGVLGVLHVSLLVAELLFVVGLDRPLAFFHSGVFFVTAVIARVDFFHSPCFQGVPSYSNWRDATE